MTKIWDFHGGVHPVQNKDQSNQLPINTMPLPKQLVLPLNQHIGSQAKAIVAPGEYVLKGQLIASAQGFISANIHAPSSGFIDAIEARTLPHQSALSGECIIINTDGKDQWTQLHPISNHEALSKQDLLHVIQAAGITGMGGAGFPSVVKLQPKVKIHTLVINAAECEPYITSDDRLMREYALQIIQGIRISQMLLDQPRCLIGIEDNKPEAIVALNEALSSLAHNTASIEVCVIPTKYPSGGEKQLLEILTGQQVPHGGIPADIGLVCQNVGTVKAIYDAVVLGQPLISRITTVTGKAAKNAGNFKVLIGTQVCDLLDFAQVDLSQTSRLVMGGPMMGFTIEDTHIPLIKSSNCLLAAADLELAPVADHHSCIRCGLCEVACPAQLLPQQLFWFAKAHEFEKAQDHNLSDCIECGACAWVCPSQIPLVQYYRFAKGKLKDLANEAHIAELSRVRFENREQRLIDEKLAKEEKRKNRATAAAAAQAAKRAANPDAQDPIAEALARVNAKKQEQQQGPKKDIDAAPKTHEQIYKELKTAAAITRTKLNKTNKALANALAKDLELAQALQATADELTTKAADAQANLQAYETKLGLDPEKEKALLTEVAKANALVRKLEKALATSTDPQEVEAQLVSARVNQTTCASALAKHQANLPSTPLPEQE
ncbi:MAG: electron transport complex subunit RsxC [Oceanospirillaceae bacterium]|nr:electron transport complex subunit RsxC [Oceanospirillaceae bacterium]